MSTPHASWANCYDLAYTLTFGNLYDDLTVSTLEVIKQELSLPATIIDSHRYGYAPAIDRIRGKFQPAASPTWASVPESVHVWGV